MKKHQRAEIAGENLMSETHAKVKWFLFPARGLRHLKIITAAMFAHTTATTTQRYLMREVCRVTEHRKENPAVTHLNA